MTVTTRSTKIKRSQRLTLKDRLSRLTYRRACQLLGPDGAQLIRRGAAYQDIDLQHDVYLRGDLFRLKLPGAAAGKDAVATITTMAEAKDRLHFNCTACETMCEHVGAAVSLVLEEKTALGLAAVPDETRPLETLSEQELVEQALGDRRSGRDEKFRLRPADPRRPWTDYTVTSALSGKTLPRGPAGRGAGQSYRSCPDFRTNTLGTCKHILHVLAPRAAAFSRRGRESPIAIARPSSTCSTARRSTLAPATARAARRRAGEALAPLADGADRRCAAAGRVPRAAGAARPYRDGLSRRRGVDPAAALPGADGRPDGRDSRRTRRPPASQQLLKVELLAVSARRHRLRRGSRPRHPGRRHGAGQDDPRRRRGRAARPRGRRPQGAGGLPGLAQVAMAERDPPLLATASAACHRRQRPSGPGNTRTTASSPSATTSRCSATSWPSSASPGT